MASQKLKRTSRPHGTGTLIKWFFTSENGSKFMAEIISPIPAAVKGSTAHDYLCLDQLGNAADKFMTRGDRWFLLTQLTKLEKNK